MGAAVSDMTELLRLARLGRRAEQRRTATAGCITVLAERSLTLVLVSLLRGWFLMLGVGIVHNDWILELRPLGYWLAVMLVALLGGTLSALPPSAKKPGAS
jgi:hypothetical protein